MEMKLQILFLFACTLQFVVCRDRIEAIAELYGNKNYSALTGAFNDYSVPYLGYVRFVQEANSNAVQGVA
jgi:hypothetical protein